MNTISSHPVELSFRELELCVRLTQHIHNVEHEEFWCITQHTQQALTSLLEVFDVATNQLDRSSKPARLSFSSPQHSILRDVFWYACNFDDFFEDVVDEAEFEEVWALYEKLKSRDGNPDACR